MRVNTKNFAKYLMALVAFVLMAALLPVQMVHAQTPYSAYDLIAAVNDLRAQNGLPPYQVDAGLMGYAQTHADYMASIASVTHIRADGSRPSDLGIQENIAMGANYSPSDVIYTLWTDSAHWNNLVGVAGGYIGAGVAQSGSFIYYAMDIRRDPNIPWTSPIPGYSTPGAQATAVSPIQQVITSTPMMDGSVLHPVGFGQTLWAIAMAYNVKIADILSMNKLPSNAVIQSGQMLIIQPAYTITPTPTITETRPPATRTLTYTPTPRTPTATRTLTPVPPTVTSTPRVLLPKIELEPRTKQVMGLILVVICAFGLVFLVVASVRKGD